MSEQRPRAREEWREIRGWVPWLLAGVYFPLYVATDLVAGGRFASLVAVPRSVSVAVFSLSVALVVTAVVIARRLDGWSLSTVAAVVDPRRTTPKRERSTVGAGGAVNRRSLESSGTPSSDVDGTRPGSNGTQKAREERADGSGAPKRGPSPKDRHAGPSAGTEHDEEWPEEWITADEL